MKFSGTCFRYGLPCHGRALRRLYKVPCRALSCFATLVPRQAALPPFGARGNSRDPGFPGVPGGARHAGEAVYETSFIEHWLSRLIFFEAPWWVFVAAYTAFAGFVLLLWKRVPPRRRRRE